MTKLPKLSPVQRACAIAVVLLSAGLINSCLSTGISSAPGYKTLTLIAILVCYKISITRCSHHGPINKH